MSNNIPDYYPFNEFRTNTIRPIVDINRISPIIKQIHNIAKSIQEDNNILNNKEKEISNILQIKKKILNNNETVYIKESVNNIEDLLNIINIYRNDDRNFSIRMDILRNLEKPLRQLNNVSGMKNIKIQIIDQIISSLLGLYDNDQIFHTVIQGPPGVGKTMLAKIIGDIYSRIGIINNKNYIFKIATRSDLVGKYLGHTSQITQDFIDNCNGGVMFIDEVYSLGNAEKRDPFAKECIDTINLNLIKNKNFVCIIAGYPNEIEDCFFAYNKGLKRRFPFIYEIKEYSSLELKKIFDIKIKNIGWVCSINEIDLCNFFEKNISNFPHFGGDIDNLITNIKTVHGKRVFGKNLKLKVITKEDLQNGMDKFMNFKIPNNINTVPEGMYV